MGVDDLAQEKGILHVHANYGTRLKEILSNNGIKCIIEAVWGDIY